jgi:pyruvate kinase
MRSVKIVATIGPRTNNKAMMLDLIAAGMDVARLNAAHGDFAWHRDAINTLRSVEPRLPILLDIPGRKVRTKTLRHEPQFDTGDSILFTTDEGYEGEVKVPVTDPNLHLLMSPGDIILADDGRLRFVVNEVAGRDITCRVETPGTLKSGKGINVPGALLEADVLGERDRLFLSFAKEMAVDFVGISFVGRAAQVKQVREAVGERGPRILSKVETQTALDNLDEVITESDAIMIDRGDLSAETELTKIALYQKHILERAGKLGKPAIVATEMLHSMTTLSVPTQAEITDISNAVLDGASALMLSGETAIGCYPVEAVSIMRSVADSVSEFQQEHFDEGKALTRNEVPQAMGEAIALLCRRLPITKIVAITISGYAARSIAAWRPRQPILAVSNEFAQARSFNILHGTEGVYVDIPFEKTSTNHIALCLGELWRSGKLKNDDLILVTSVSYPKSGNRMNLVQTHSVNDLRVTLNWVK